MSAKPYRVQGKSRPGVIWEWIPDGIHTHLFNQAQSNSLIWEWIPDGIHTNLLIQAQRKDHLWEWIPDGIHPNLVIEENLYLIICQPGTGLKAADNSLEHSIRVYIEVYMRVYLSSNNLVGQKKSKNQFLKL